MADPLAFLENLLKLAAAGERRLVMSHDKGV